MAKSNVLAQERVALGKRLRLQRKQFGWTLAELSEKAGVSVTTISRAERGQLALGYANLAALAKALMLDVGALFSKGGSADNGAHGQPVVTRAGEGVVYRGLSFTYEFLATSGAQKSFNPVLGTVHARAVNGPEDYARHEGEEFVYVLQGEIDVHFESGETVRLRRGDSLYFDSRIGHAFVSASRQLAKVIGVITNESNHMQVARRGRQPAAAERTGT
jgi:transcriptional regulator with XRE-family HTH domain